MLVFLWVSSYNFKLIMFHILYKIINVITLAVMDIVYVVEVVDKFKLLNEEHTQYIQEPDYFLLVK